MNYPTAIAASVVALSLGLPSARPRPLETEGRIRLVGHMRSARAAQTATTIADDRVLIAGGMAEGGGAVRTFEIFDARTNRITLAGEMLDVRATHTATRLPDGRVLVAGGYNGTYVRSAEIFDPRTGRFALTGRMNQGRSGHTATLLADGTVLLTGGVGDNWSFLSSAEVFDPRTAKFSPVGSMSVARESHTATLLTDGRVLIAAGHRDRRDNIMLYASTELYDPAQRAFISGPALKLARHKHDAVSLDDGRVLIIGGSDPRDRTRFVDAEICDLRAARCAPTGEMRIGRYKVRDTAIRLPVRRDLRRAGASVPRSCWGDRP
jgi:hypothetical protein